jgi:hypothetical protein
MVRAGKSAGRPQRAAQHPVAHESPPTGRAQRPTRMQWGLWMLSVVFLIGWIAFLAFIAASV